MLAGIYLGQITSWNDRKIKAINKGAKLPNEKIVVAFRSDGSGDTYAFTNYLSHVSSQFRGSGRQRHHGPVPGRRQRQGQLGRDLGAQSTPGSIAYIAASYLIARRLPAVAVGNAGGKLRVSEPAEHRECGSVGPQRARAPASCTSSTRPDENKVAYPDLDLHLRDRPHQQLPGG